LTQLVFQTKIAPSGKQSPLGTFLREYKPQGLRRYVDSQRRWVGVYFHSHDNYILSKMLIDVCLSIFLMAVMIISFIYLIKIILDQKKLAEMKDDFINNLTHEFKTPIATIAVAIEGLQNFNALQDPAKTKEYLNISKNELGRLDDMVSNVLNLASQKQNSIELNLDEINLAHIIQETLDREKFRTDKAVNFTVDIEEGANRIKVDPLHFKNIITNLVDNAIKYSRQAVQIKISAKKHKDRLIITFSDNGIGIPDWALKYVFDKFYRVSNGNIYNIKGIGLGLSYVKLIVELHKGNISVRSKLDVGTEFSINIPLN
ncbi:MAG: HAMP domain-containing histidine kinase, partial [Flavobacterium sp.]